MAMNDYKQKSGRMFPTWSEVLEVLRALGYEKVIPAVDPDTAARDLDIPRTLMRTLGHCDCGIYAEVVTGGTVRIDDKVETLRESLL